MEQSQRLDIMRQLFEDDSTIDALTVMNVLSTDTQTLSADFKVLLEAGEIIKVAPGQYRKAFDVRHYLEQPLTEREKKQYNGEFLEEYIPNTTYFLWTDAQKLINDETQYFEYSFWKNTENMEYFFLETIRALARSEWNLLSDTDILVLSRYWLEPHGYPYTEIQKIQSIKTALLYLINPNIHIDLWFKDFEYLHQVLGHSRLEDYHLGKLRSFEHIIPDTTYLPLTQEVQLEIQMSLFLEKLRHIENPYEQSFFLLVFLIYLQPFQIINIELAKLMSLIPLIKHSRAPLLWSQVDSHEFEFALRALYELCDVSFLREVYLRQFQG